MGDHQTPLIAADFPAAVIAVVGVGLTPRILVVRPVVWAVTEVGFRDRRMEGAMVCWTAAGRTGLSVAATPAGFGELREVRNRSRSGLPS